MKSPHRATDGGGPRSTQGREDGTGKTRVRRITCVTALSGIVLALTAAAADSGASAAGPAQAKRSGRPAARAAAKSAPRAAPKPNPIATLVGALSLNSVKPGEDLYAACDRANFQALAWALDGVKDRIALEKSGYETEAEFGERRGKLEGAMSEVGQVVVCQPLDDNEDAPFSYDAEREVFRGTFDARQNVWRDVKRLGSYVSKTRMGVRATVKASAQFEYDVDMGAAFRGTVPACLKSRYGDYSYEVPIARAQAPALKSSGYLVFVGRLVSPFYGSSDSPGSPTLDDPRDVYERVMTVHFAPVSAVVVGPGGLKPWECRIGEG